jgi:hypothetical protein
MNIMDDGRCSNCFSVVNNNNQCGNCKSTLTPTWTKWWSVEEVINELEVGKTLVKILEKHSGNMAVIWDKLKPAEQDKINKTWLSK